MTQPDNPAPSRSARPQLFGEAKGPKSRQPDFGPSILATIEGEPRHESMRRDGISLRQVLWMSAFALGVVLVYFTVKLEIMPKLSPSPPSGVAGVQVSASAPVAMVEASMPTTLVEAAASAASATGVASIENVALPVVNAASVAVPMPAPGAAAGVGVIQQALERSETAEPRMATRPESVKNTPVVTPTVIAKQPAVKKEAATGRSATAGAKAKSDGDSDTELLAAMLPHLKHRNAAPTSAAYEKRCGQLHGNDAVECRAKFCNGQEGVDAACPLIPTR